MVGMRRNITKSSIDIELTTRPMGNMSYQRDQKKKRERFINQSTLIKLIQEYNERNKSAMNTSMEKKLLEGTIHSKA